MITGTRREIVEILSKGEASATEIAEELDLSLPTIHRHLTSLREKGYVRESGKRSGKTRPYKLYSVEESAYLFSILGSEIVERSLDLTAAHETLFSILQVPQTEFHPVLISHLFSLPADWEGRKIHSIAVYGSVAHGDATEESDIDLLFVTEKAEQDDVFTDSLILDNVVEEFDNRRIVSNKVLTIDEMREGIELDSQFLRNVVEEMIILYDPDDFLTDVRDSYVGQTNASSGVS
jgi:DNA-binding transcriptional ArsR family regulator/predicted nucleotidyltransferase